MTQSCVLSGIANCDTVRKARAWLGARGVAYDFHDFKRMGVDELALGRWIDRFGWEALLNRHGTTFRKLPESERADLDTDKATALMLAHPSAIRRPVLEAGALLLVGFTPARYEEAGLGR